MLRQVAAQCVLSCVDDSGSRGTLTLHVGGNTGIAAARSACEGLAGLLPSVTSCEVTSYTITYQTYLAPSYPDGPASERDRAVFVFETDEPDAYGVVSVPGVAAALVDDHGGIDPGLPAVAALVAKLVAGPWCNPAGDELTVLAVSYYEFKL